MPFNYICIVTKVFAMLKKITSYLSLLLLSVMPSFVSAETVVVTQSGFAFSPQGFTCNVGDVIRWEWTGGTHNTMSASVPAGAATWQSDLDQATQFFEYTVEVAGTYAYVCSFHAQSGMAGAFQASAPTSVKPVLSSNRDMTVGVELGSKTIHIRLDGGADASGAIHIYDLTGKQAATIYQGNFGTEEKSYTYDAAALGRGIYFVRFETNAKVITRKIMLD